MVGIVLCLVGITGSWIVNGPLTNGLSESLTSVENVLSITRKGIGRVESELTGIQDKIEKISQDIIRTSGELTDNAAAFNMIKTITEWKLETRLETATETIDLILEVVASVNHVVEKANESPFLSIPMLPKDKLMTIDKRLSEALTAVQDIELIEADMKSGITKKTIPSLATQTIKIDRIAEDIRISVAEFKASVDAAKKTTANFKANLSIWIDLASLIISLIFVWLILAQLCLFIHSRD
jgi:hypothetical protein